jgi:hypothetical protein
VAEQAGRGKLHARVVYGEEVRGRSAMPWFKEGLWNCPLQANLPTPGYLNTAYIPSVATSAINAEINDFTARTRSPAGDVPPADMRNIPAKLLSSNVWPYCREEMWRNS